MTDSSKIACYPHPDFAKAEVYQGPMHLAIGMFDGVHLGHRQVLQQAVRASRRQQDHYAGVLTFDPHPSRVLYPERATRMLMSLVDRVGRIHSNGIDLVFVQKFTRLYAQRKAAEFVPMLVDRFAGLKSIHVGENFRFGSGRSGTIETLEEGTARYHIELHVVERKVMDGLAISSSRIRKALAEGSIGEVNRMLGDPYTAYGRVIRGKGVGRKIRIPTLNVPWEPEIAPRFGVYQVKLKHLLKGEFLDGIANYGLRPTVETASNPVIEVHLLDGVDFPQPDDPVEVELMEFIRPEMDFQTMDALRQQIEKDIQLVREKLKGSHPSR